MDLYIDFRPGSHSNYCKSKKNKCIGISLYVKGVGVLQLTLFAAQRFSLDLSHTIMTFMSLESVQLENLRQFLSIFCV